MWRIRYFFLAICLMGWFAQPAGAESYVLGVVPQFPATEVYRAWTPVLEAIKEKTGIHLALRVYETIPIFEKSFLAGEPDLVYYNPYHAVMGWRSQRYLPLVRGNDKPLTGILVVAEQGPIRSLRDLQGKTVSFPAPNAFGASLYMRALLAEKYGLKIKPVYTRTHGNAYRSVALGETAAAGGIAVTLAGEPMELRDQLRVLYETPGAAPHPIAAHPRVPAKVQQAIRDALLALPDNATGVAMLADIKMSKLIAADYVRDYHPLERLGLERYVVLSE